MRRSEARSGLIRSAVRERLGRDLRVWSALGAICAIQSAGTAFGLWRIDVARLSATTGEPFSTILLLLWMVLGGVVLGMTVMAGMQWRRIRAEYRAAPRYERILRATAPEPEREQAMVA
ncbi:MAG: hypothetical protein HYY93_16445 [Planctomycetes bacterium]|nr:hypothetical protein [Planctomycetota bacterium]